MHSAIICSRYYGFVFFLPAANWIFQKNQLYKLIYSLVVYETYHIWYDIISLSVGYIWRRVMINASMLTYNLIRHLYIPNWFRWFLITTTLSTFTFNLIKREKKNTITTSEVLDWHIYPNITLLYVALEWWCQLKPSWQYHILIEGINLF